MASFACDQNGQGFSAVVLAATFLLDPTGTGGNWQDVALFGFRTPRGQEAAASQVRAHMRQSFKPDRRWQAALSRRAGRRARKSSGEALSQQPASPDLASMPGAPPQRDIMTPFLVQQAEKEDSQQQRICTIRNDGILVRYWNPQFGRWRPRCN